MTRYVGDTQARGAMGGVPAKTPKMVFLYPLRRDWRAVLLGKPSAPAPRGLNRPGPDSAPRMPGSVRSGSGNAALTRVQIATGMPVVGPASQSPALTPPLVDGFRRLLPPTSPPHRIDRQTAL